MRTIRVYGALAKFVGRRSFEAVANSAAEAVRFLAANFPGLDAHMAQYHYAFLVGGESINPHEQLHDPVGQAAEICVVPVLGGAGGPVGRIIAGIGLVALSFVTGGAAIGLFGLAAPLAISPILLGLGASMALGGVAELLSPVPVLSGPGEWGQDDSKDPRKNYAFSGISNTARVGMIVPLGYGKSWTGSLPVSQTIDLTSDVTPYVEPIVIGDISVYGSPMVRSFQQYAAAQAGNAAGTTWTWSVSPATGVTITPLGDTFNEVASFQPGYGSTCFIELPSSAVAGTEYAITVAAANPNAKDGNKTVTKNIVKVAGNAQPWLGLGPGIGINLSPPAVGVPTRITAYMNSFAEPYDYVNPSFTWRVFPSTGVVQAPDPNDNYPGWQQNRLITLPRTDIKYVIIAEAAKSVGGMSAKNNGAIGCMLLQPGYVLGPVTVTGPAAPAANTFTNYTATQAGLPATWAWEVTPAGATIFGSGATVSIRFPPSLGNWQVRAIATNAIATNGSQVGTLSVTTT